MTKLLSIVILTFVGLATFFIISSLNAGFNSKKIAEFRNVKELWREKDVSLVEIENHRYFLTYMYYGVSAMVHSETCGCKNSK